MGTGKRNAYKPSKGSPPKKNKTIPTETTPNKLPSPFTRASMLANKKTPIKIKSEKKDGKSGPPVNYVSLIPTMLPRVALFMSSDESGKNDGFFTYVHTLVLSGTIKKQKLESLRDQVMTEFDIVGAALRVKPGTDDYDEEHRFDAKNQRHWLKRCLVVSFPDLDDDEELTEEQLKTKCVQIIKVRDDSKRFHNIQGLNN